MIVVAVSVTEGEVSFRLKVSAEIAPDVQIVAYAVLPSETVIAHSADFSTEKCFTNKVSMRRRLAVLTVLVRSRRRIKRYYSCTTKGQYLALQDQPSTEVIYRSSGRTITPSMRRHDRWGQQRYTAEEERESIGHQQWMKM